MNEFQNVKSCLEELDHNKDKTKSKVE